MEENQKFEELQLSVPWGHVSAKAWGSPSDKKMLAVHGLLDNAGTFDRIIKLLPKDYYIVSIDLPGHGFSSHFNQGVPLHFFSYVLTIYHVLNALHWDTCTYMGHSFGGHIGTMFSILYPQRFDKLILLDAFLSIPVVNDELISCLRDSCNSAIKATDMIPRLYSKEDVLYALTFKRFSTLNTEAAEALFNRAVTEVNNLYKYNRDFRLMEKVLPFFNVEQVMKCLESLSTPCVVIIPSSSLAIYTKYSIFSIINRIAKINDLVNVVNVVGNHDVHNNYPERVAPSICKFLSSNIKSKL